MSDSLSRRNLIKGAGLGSLTVLTLSGCTSESPANRQPHFVMVFDQNKCVGCGDCKTACQETNHLPKGVMRMTLQERDERMNGTTEGDRKFTRVSCQQCKDAPCVKVCPTGAAMRDAATGIVTMDKSRCVGCKYCIVACPYNVRFINPETKTAENCDFCLHTKLARGEEPACVESCRHNALIFGDAADPESYVSKLLRVKDSVRIKPNLGTEPSLRYIPIVKTGVR